MYTRRVLLSNGKWLLVAVAMGATSGAASLPPPPPPQAANSHVLARHTTPSQTLREALLRFLCTALRSMPCPQAAPRSRMLEILRWQAMQVPVPTSRIGGTRRF
jgi:hypothetical protein